MLERIKSIFARRKGNWRGKSKEDKEELISEVLDRLNGIEQDIILLIQQVGEIASYCDKCDGNKTVYCMKCDNTGIARKDRLRNWPWQ